jgi:hypothetical protein
LNTTTNQTSTEKEWEQQHILNSNPQYNGSQEQQDRPHHEGDTITPIQQPAINNTPATHQITQEHLNYQQDPENINVIQIHEEQTNPRRIQQTLPQYDSTPNKWNDAWGAAIKNLPPTNFRIYFQTINGIQFKSKQLSKWHPHLQYIRKTAYQSQALQKPIQTGAIGILKNT